MYIMCVCVRVNVYTPLYVFILLCTRRVFVRWYKFLLLVVIGGYNYFLLVTGSVILIWILGGDIPSTPSIPTSQRWVLDNKTNKSRCVNTLYVD